MSFKKWSFNVAVSDHTISITEGRRNRAELFSVCETQTCPICIFVLQDGIRINVTTLKDDGEVSKEQVCLFW